MKPFVSSFSVGVLPGLTVFTGIVMLIWGIIGVTLAISYDAPTYFIGTNYIFHHFAKLRVLQFSFLKEPSSGSATLHDGLAFMIIFKGAFLVLAFHTQ